MSAEAALGRQSITSGGVLFLAFDMGNTKWKLAFTIGRGQDARVRTIDARDLVRLSEEIGKAKKRFGLSENALVVTCYEAGRDGFWLHRYLEQQGISNVVVDPGSVRKSGRSRNAKTDRLDARVLLLDLIRYWEGDKGVWKTVRVPSREQEDGRQLHRELGTLKQERTREVNRIKGLLATQGVLGEVRGPRKIELEAVRLWDGSPLPFGMKERIRRGMERVEFLEKQIREIEGQRQEAMTSPQGDEEKRLVGMVQLLMGLRSVGLETGWVLVQEFFGWRGFTNEKEVGALAGLTPTPHQSGDLARDLGISKSGNRRVRALAIELAWSWVRWQPDSALTRWYHENYGGNGKRMRRIGIVALARKLLVLLWKYVEWGEIPEGAELKRAA